jgi:hypothetical protein
MLMLGLSRGNTERLLDGKPIPVELKELLGIDAVLVIVGGETEDAIARGIARDAEEAGAAVEVDVAGPFASHGPRGQG